ncbi:MAG TPA: starch-binding outer membrane lipoprotein SusD [Candidatus Prevotella avicola]|uniref:Starch-binding outer membrane lipoprotein SusD n=1 Tax=Candidatus Prevotella avicola TaxID=2838738 RepID=A0A9D2G0T1_9BACT|nr:starch-binding outer membrane lipoprotein SusD [Candidatus Prevotella avicola]
MKKTMIKTVLAGILALGMVSCADDLNISSIDPQTDPSYDPMQLLAKQYACLSVTGQSGPAGQGDISGDEGESGFYRTLFNLQELCTDEVAWAWQNDEGIPELTNIQWNASSARIKWCYQRLAFNVMLFNQYLTEQDGVADPAYIAEVRFLRALHYYYYLDLFHKAPFKTVFNTTELPVDLGGKDLYDWLDKELTEVEPLMAEVGAYNNTSDYGRADRGAAYMLHARLALNSSVYTDGQVNDLQKAIDYCDRITQSGAYKLSTESKNGFSGYAQLFMGDNDQNSEAMKETIFPIRCDGLRTQSYSSSTYIIASMYTDGMPYLNGNAKWQCMFSRSSLVGKFFSDPENQVPMATEDDVKMLPAGATETDIRALDEQLGISTKDVIAAAGDDRAMFYAGVGGGVRELSVSRITAFLNGLSIVKWTNYRTDGAAGNNENYYDTDIPLFRYAEVLLTRAEANFRLGHPELAVPDINELRGRAHASTVSTEDITEDFLIDEWSREFFVEGRRRSDLVRFGRFSGSSYIWPFKGGVPTGTGVQSFYDIYPIPSDELASNKNMSQNPDY